MPPYPELSAREQALLLEWMVDHLDAVRADTVPQRRPHGEPPRGRLSVAILAAIHLGPVALLVRALVPIVVRLLRARCGASS